MMVEVGMVVVIDADGLWWRLCGVVVVRIPQKCKLFIDFTRNGEDDGDDVAHADTLLDRR